jgi:microcystin-dependent protein
MANTPYIGEIRTFGFSFAPVGNALCNGQILSISQNTALFSLLGTTYGGNGTTTFALPDLRSRVPIHYGQGPGQANYAMGQMSGTDAVTITTNQIPAHTHTFANNGSTMTALPVKATSQTPAAGSLLGRSNDTSTAASQPLVYLPAGTAGTAVPLGGLNIAGTNSLTGGNQPVSVLQPYLALNYSIALQGIFPSRN